MSTKTQVLYEATPNPQALKFLMDRVISSEQASVTRTLNFNRSPLAQKLLGFPWAEQVFIGPTFVTVTKQDWVEWSIIAEPLSQLIAEHLDSAEPVLLEALETTPSTEDILETDSDIVKQIKNILNAEIRPAVAMDGGDIIFNKYVDDVLYLQMQGSCNGCPSSTYTLKEGIETRMKERIPGLKEVVAI